jgi:hypothetical protein
MISVVMAASTTAGKRSGARLRTGSARGHGLPPVPLDGLIGRVGQRSGDLAAASGENV